MKTIYKYPLNTAAEQIIEIPMLYLRDRVARCSEQVLHVDVQNQVSPCIWCMVETERGMHRMKVVTKLTGEAFDDDDEASRLQYVGTYLLANGAFVGHVFVCEE